MSEWWTPVLAVAGGALLFWCVLVSVLWAQQRRVGRSVNWREAMRLIPDVIHLVRALLRDHTVPRSVRWSLICLLGYLVLPIDLIPDVIPVLGIADDILIVALVLRFAIRRSGTAAIARNWRGSNEGLQSLLNLTIARS
ncbi:uncharacterized membrane protein YkvA (DUF1232 family) [Microbacterium halimionae]|uniref:Uncharacterized membrane protein YkvA (DUF1232 family) n=1 Tax=Microbacterium halimionae TaxID=1526413 RepID=A0A7W3JMC8_9MICO|nr:YkvA family protein [Microbacterium halimionae]MBA8815463.1 uncharacterized membrane protein YkvA (DUF1232 family) [Microbacterium halimionae]NII95510.1 uncharacterized membrane protein YkvA (DUF1232 family) [Microbacterium halimionae]